MEIVFQDGLGMIPIPKAVLSREGCIAALKRGKPWRRWEAMAKRQAPMQA